MSDAAPLPNLPIAVLLSGGGRTMQNLMECIQRGELPARVVSVIASNAQAYGIDRAKQWQLPCQVVARKSFIDPAAFSQAIWSAVRPSGARLVVLAGFMSLLNIPDDFAGRVINIHPALLPAFGGPGMYGHHVHEAVLAYGCKVSGCTVHYCDQTYDTGPILVQRTCPVLEDDTADTLAARVFEQECLAYPQAIKLIAEGRVHLQNHRATIAPAQADVRPD